MIRWLRVVHVAVVLLVVQFQNWTNKKMIICSRDSLQSAKSNPFRAFGLTRLLFSSSGMQKIVKPALLTQPNEIFFYSLRVFWWQKRVRWCHLICMPFTTFNAFIEVLIIYRGELASKKVSTFFVCGLSFPKYACFFSFHSCCCCFCRKMKFEMEARLC